MNIHVVDYGRQKLRRSKAETEQLKNDIRSILERDNPTTVRQVFYQMVVRGCIEKSEQEYKGVVIRLLTEMRVSGALPFSWIVDESRRTQITRTYASVADAVADTANFYRRSALRECKDYLEIWSEKDALSGILFEVANEYDVPVVVSKGTPSITQIFTTFRSIYEAAKAGKETYIYQFGDHDPTGCIIIEAMRYRLDQFCRQYDCAPPTIVRAALTEDRVHRFSLPTRPTKREGNSHAKNFIGDSTELDALPSAVLRTLVRDCIEQHILREALDALRVAEASERSVLQLWGKGLPQQETTP
jgi:hypothetical protein